MGSVVLRTGWYVIGRAVTAPHDKPTATHRPPTTFHCTHLGAERIIAHVDLVEVLDGAQRLAHGFEHRQRLGSKLV